MKLSESTIEILKNFSTINPGIIVKPGSVLKTVAPNRTIFATAHIEETFDKEFALYDLIKTLGILSMSKKGSPEIELGNDSLIIKSLGGTAKVRQRYSATNMIVGHDFMDNKIPEFTPDAQIVLTQETNNWIFSVSSILKCPHIVIRSTVYNPETSKFAVELATMDVKGVIVDDASVPVVGSSDKEFSIALRVEDIKIINGEYEVDISKHGFCHLKNKERNIQYWVTYQRKESKFEE